MKNLMIYINPKRDFDDEAKIMVKIQIDNILDLGWKRKDILLVTNFPYKYNGIEAHEVSSDNFCYFFPKASKITTIIDLFKRGLIEKGQLYWFHDLDAFQNVVITQSEIELELGKAQMGLTDKGRMPRWSTGSIFFKSSTEDIFGWTKEILYKYQMNEESSLMVVTENNILWVTMMDTAIGDDVLPANIPGTENIKERVKKINISYNLVTFNIRSTFKMAVKPIRVVHFHIFDESRLDFFLRGKNKLDRFLMPERLIKIFNKHEIK